MKPSMDRAEMPLRIRALPVNDAGYPIPWFVATIDGKPDFRVIERGRIEYALRNPVCWVCGGIRLVGGAPAAFVTGPMCAVNRVSAEPPSHIDCAVYSATHCPFLTIPKMHRRETIGPVAKVGAGISIRRNPGVALVWISRTWRPFRDPEGGWLFDIGEPLEARWYAEGREATRDEVMTSIESGLPILRDMAVEEGPDALAALMNQHAAAMELLPL